MSAFSVSCFLSLVVPSTPSLRSVRHTRTPSHSLWIASESFVFVFPLGPRSVEQNGRYTRQLAFRCIESLQWNVLLRRITETDSVYSSRSVLKTHLVASV